MAALTSLCYGHDAAMLRATEGGALRVAVAVMRAHPQDYGMQLKGTMPLIRFGKRCPTPEDCQHGVSVGRTQAACRLSV